MRVFTIETTRKGETRMFVVVADAQEEAESLVADQMYPGETIGWSEEVSLDYARVVTKSELI